MRLRQVFARERTSSGGRVRPALFCDIITRFLNYFLLLDTWVHHFSVTGAREGCMSPLKERTFDLKTFLAGAGLGRTILQYRKNKVIFAQGEPCDSVFYIQVGRVKLTVRSTQGKEATIAMLGVGNFLGEACITSNQPLRVSSAQAITDCSVLRIEKQAMRKCFTLSMHFHTSLSRIWSHVTTGFKRT